MMEDRYYAFDIGLFRVSEAYQIELAFTDPTSQAQVSPRRAALQFDLEALLAVQGLHAEYGAALTAQLFADPAVKQEFLRGETAAQATSSFLRVSLRIDPSAQELHALRWELLRHPETGAALATSERLLLSRFIVSHDWRPVRLRPRSQLRALIAVSAPVGPRLAKMNLAPVDFEAEVSRVRAVLGDMQVTTLGGPGSPCTLSRLLGALRGEVDVLYLVSHGIFTRSTGAPNLILQDESGEVEVVKGEDLAAGVAELQTAPRLMVLASCQSAGDGNLVAAEQRVSVQATLAGRLADAGVPAIVAMQGSISMATVAAMMPVFFAELTRDGQIDRAIAVARGVVRGRDDCWMPALYMRLKTGQIWYTPGFRGGSEAIWHKLLAPIRKGKLVPVIGPGVLDAVQGTSFEVARKLAETHRFPLAAFEWDDLPRVTQFLSVTLTRFNVIQAYKDQITENVKVRHRSWLPQAELDRRPPSLARLQGLVSDRLREQSETDVYRLLADLPASVYVTTNHDPLLERALKAKDRAPQLVLSRWRYNQMPTAEAGAQTREPSTRAPIVYHAFGVFGKDTDDTLVLAEDDYFDYLLKAAVDKLIPDDVATALVDNSLLFIGFRLTDWTFRVLFRLLRSLSGIARSANYPHVAVQFDPELQTMKDVDGARAYLQKYLQDEAKIEIFWGTAGDFLTALRDALAQTAGAAAEPEVADDGEY